MIATSQWMVFGLARRVAAVRLGGRLEAAQPTFWE